MRLLRREARAGGAAGGEAAAPGCALTPSGDEIASAPPEDEPEPGFEGRNVNGWII